MLRTGKLRPRGASGLYQVPSRSGPFLGEKPLISASFQAGREACEKAPRPPRPWPRGLGAVAPPPQLVPAPTPKQPQGTPYKPFSFARPTGLPHPHGSLELDEIFYDPTLRYVLLKAPVLASAGTSARPSPGASSPSPPPPLTARGGRRLPPHCHLLPSQSGAPSPAVPQVKADWGIENDHSVCSHIPNPTWSCSYP